MMIKHAFFSVIRSDDVNGLKKGRRFEGGSRDYDNRSFYLTSMNNSVFSRSS